jgi:hypothetical protein
VLRECTSGDDGAVSQLGAAPFTWIPERDRQ